MAYVHDARRGEVTVLKGTPQTTYHDPALVKRLLAAAPGDDALSGGPHMSSHREAPEISKDPVADNADVYAFVSPDKPDTVTLISNFVPLQDPAGGPNFFEFGDDVLYSIYIDNDGDGVPEIAYQFQFETKTQTPTRSSTTPGRSAR